MSEKNSDKIDSSSEVNQKDLEDSELIDENVQKEVSGNFPEDPLITEYATQDETKEKDEKVNVTSEWIGNEDEWKAKSKLSAEQIIALIQVRMLPNAYEELEPLEDLFNQMVEDMEKYAVSHNGLAREQHVDVLRAMHSGEMGEKEGERNALLEAFSAASNVEDE